MKKAVIKTNECVACGCCQKLCPKKAINIIHGLYAYVDEALCVGCKMCQKACPASIIEMEDR